MTVRYFRFVSPEAIAAGAAYNRGKATLVKQGTAIGKAFGGRPIYSTTIHGHRFLGLAFNPQLDSPLWTRPNPRSLGMQVPRRKVRSALRHELAELQQRWQTLEPTMDVDTKDLFAACGTDWSNFVFSGGGWKITDKAIFIATGTDLSAHGEEITGGQYEAAKNDDAAVQP